MKKRNKDNELAVIEILRSTGIDILEAALIAKRALEAGRGRVKRALRCIAAGEQELRRQQRTVTFARAVDEALKARADLRKRTRTDFRYISQRLIKYCPGLAQRKVRCITAAECEAYLRKAFCTPRQRNKARLILSGIFATACKQGWCSRNPARELAPEKIEEKRIRILSHEEISRLLHTAATHEGGICLAAVALMLYAGIRPHEVERLHWKDVHMDSGVICISPRHSKTGGARCVTIHPPLAEILTGVQKDNKEPLCPPNWRKRWAELHRKAGFHVWQPDVLRHTFATHHLATFRSYAELQVEMGHRSAELLRTRYVAMAADHYDLLKK